MKKFFIYFLIISSGAFLMSCNDDDDTTPKKKVGNSGSSTTTVGINTEVTFSDPVEALSRKWTVSPSDNATVTGELTSESIKVSFSKAGSYTVKSERTFDLSLFDKEKNDTTINVTVLGAVEALFTAVYVNEDNSDGEALKLENDALNEIEQGQKIRFTHVSKGSPSASVWTFEGGNPDKANDIAAGGSLDVTYGTLGEFGITVVASRTTPEGSSTLTYSKFIKVVEPSTPPVALEISATSIVDGKIAIEYNQTLSTLAGADLGSSFSLNILNLGTAATPAVSAVSLSASDSTLLLEVDGGIKKSDSILVTYDNSNGVIKRSRDDEAGAAFSDVLVSNSMVAKNSGFEDMYLTSEDVFITGRYGQINVWDPSMAGNYGDALFISNGVEYKAKSDWTTVTTTKVGDNSFACKNGNACVRYMNTVKTSNNDVSNGHGDNQYTLTAGNEYFLSVSVYVVSSGQYNDGTTEVPASFNIYMPKHAGWGDVAAWNLEDLPTGEWTRLTKKFIAGETEENGTTYIMGRVRGLAEVYADDWYLVEVEER